MKIDVLFTHYLINILFAYFKTTGRYYVSYIFSITSLSFLNCKLLIMSSHCCFVIKTLHNYSDTFINDQIIFATILSKRIIISQAKLRLLYNKKLFPALSINYPQIKNILLSHKKTIQQLSTS